MTIGLWGAHHKIRFFNFQETISKTNYSYIYMKPRAKRASRCQDIHKNQFAPPAAEETQIQNCPLRLARRSDFGLGRRSSVFRRSGNTNPRGRRVRISRDNGNSRGRSSFVVVNTPSRESGGSWFETCSGAWYPRRRPCGVAFNALVDLNKLAGETPSFKFLAM